MYQAGGAEVARPKAGTVAVSQQLGKFKRSVSAITLRQNK
jgi:hypothetical protein